MYITRVSLTDYRCFSELSIGFGPGLNVLTGRNAQGKSAILESVYLLATSKSHRTSKDQELIRFDQNVSRVVGSVMRSSRNDAVIEMAIDRSGKKLVKVDGSRKTRVSEMVGQLAAVIFSGSDIEMVKGEPELRRRFLNLEISQTSPKYVIAFASYKRALEQRNTLLKNLKNGTGESEQLDVWDNQLSAYGSAMMKQRSEFIEGLAKTSSEIYGFLTDSAEHMRVAYKSSINMDSGASEEDISMALAKRLKARQELDLQRGTTSVGPHRDDVYLEVQGTSVRDFGSQGQQRCAAIALKLAEISVLESYIGECPVILLDEITAELDESRRRRITQLAMGKGQTILATANPGELDSGALEDAVVLEVESGSVTQVRR